MVKRNTLSKNAVSFVGSQFSQERERAINAVSISLPALEPVSLRGGNWGKNENFSLPVIAVAFVFVSARTSHTLAALSL